MAGARSQEREWVARFRGATKAEEAVEAAWERGRTADDADERRWRKQKAAILRETLRRPVSLQRRVRIGRVGMVGLTSSVWESNGGMQGKFGGLNR